MTNYQSINVSSFSLEILPEHRTGTCVCLIDNDNRCCYANIGASIHYSKEFLKQNLNSLSTQLSPSPLMVLSSFTLQQIFYVEGFFVSGDRFSVCKYIVEEICQASSGSIFFATNLSAKYMINKYPNEIKYLAEHANILFGNYGEFTKLAEIYELCDVEHVINHLLTINLPHCRKKIVVCTQGSKSILYACSGFNTSKTHGIDDVQQNDFDMHSVREFTVAKVSAKKIVDTTGCGDAFVAGFFYAFLRNETIKACIAKGTEIAMEKLTSVGGTLN